MNTNDPDELNQQRKRRKRVARMKSAITITVAGWMILSLVAIVVLAVQVVHLNHRIDNLVDGNNGQAQEQQTSIQAKAETGETTDDDPTEELDSSDNLASDGDTHQVYLTFDSGPDDNTNTILDILAENQIKATFFVAGNDKPEMQDVYRRIVSDGHTLGMHSYSNQYSTIYASTDAFRQDLQQIQALLTETTGTQCVYYRFPGGSNNQISNADMKEFARVLNENGITYFDWNVSAGDNSAGCSVDDIVKNVVAGVSRYKTSIVLLHDGEDQNTTVEALGPLILALRDMNAEILPIDDNTKVIQYLHSDDVE